MAGVKSLSVRGIRSFGPEDCDEQRISFDRPLTLILGQNGCGKTTIIECLRYAVTGQMPPGSRNECFVHDAKVNRSTEVLGQVKLKVCFVYVVFLFREESPPTNEECHQPIQLTPSSTYNTEIMKFCPPEQLGWCHKWL